MRRPNILVLVADQLRADCVGPVRGKPSHTPNLDRLASEGLSFSNAFTHIPTCCPARQSFLHGGRPETFGAHWNYDIGLSVPTLDPLTSRTWTADLRAGGYQSSYIGKWHVHPTATPLAFGYDSFISTGDYERFRVDSGHLPLPETDWEGRLDPVPTADSRTHWLASQAVEWLTEHSCRPPWHLRVDFVEPHLPSCPTEEFAALLRGQVIDPWDNWNDPLVGKPFIQSQQQRNWGVDRWNWDDWTIVVRNYLAVVSQMDNAVGRILACLDNLDLANQTLVVFTSDHGDMTGSHGMLDKHYVLYDEVLRVPLILRWPSRWEPAVDNSLVYSFLDLAPMMYSLVSDEIPDQCVGRSLLLQREGKLAGRNHVVSTFNGQQFGLYTARGLRTTDWKYIWNATDVDELYDIRNDPAELRNLSTAREHQIRIANFRRELYSTLLDEGDAQVANEWIKRQLLMPTEVTPR